MRIDPNGNKWWKWVVAALVIVVVTAAIVVTAGALAAAVGVAVLPVMVGAGVGGLVAGTVNLVSQGIQTGWDANKINFASLVISTGIGAISGAFGGTALGTGWQIGINAGLSGGEYLLNHAFAGGSFSWGGLATNIGLGAFSGWVSGPGAMTPGVGELTGPAFWRAMYPNSRHFTKQFTSATFKAGARSIVQNGIMGAHNEWANYWLTKGGII